MTAAIQAEAVAPVPAETVAGWTLWNVRRPGDYNLVYRWTIDARMICGLMLKPEWSQKMALHGMGYSKSEWWPKSYWDGFKRHAAPGLSWRLATEAEAKEERPIYHGLDLLPCPHTGRPPRVITLGDWCPPWNVDRLGIEAFMVKSLGWNDAAKMRDTWNTRPPMAAAAPEMLEVLRHLVRWHDQLSAKDIARAEAIIAKATSEVRS